MSKRYSCILPLLVAVNLIGCLFIGNESTSIDYTIEDCSYKRVTQNEDIELHYPQIRIQGKKSENLAAKINDILYERGVNTYLNYFQNEGLNAKGTYEVELQTDTVLSVHFEGDVYVNETAHPCKMCFAVNLEADTGKVLLLSDFISAEELQQAFESGSFVLLEGIHELLQDENAYKIFAERYLSSPIIYQDTEHSYDFYVSGDDKICIIIDVGHSNGDFVVLEVNIQKSKLDRQSMQ